MREGRSGRLSEHLLGPDKPGRVANPGAWMDRPVGGMSVHFACNGRHTYPARSAVCVRLRAPSRLDWSPSGAELVCGQAVPQVGIVDLVGMDGQRCRDVSVRPDQIEPARLQPALLV